MSILPEGLDLYNDSPTYLIGVSRDILHAAMWQAAFSTGMPARLPQLLKAYTLDMLLAMRL